MMRQRAEADSIILVILFSVIKYFWAAFKA